MARMSKITATAITGGMSMPDRGSLRVQTIQPPRETGNLNRVSMLASLGSERRRDSSIPARARRSAGARLMAHLVQLRKPDLTRG
jgi:hypothetical protein